MIIADMLGWWYSRGWMWALHQLFVVRTKHIAEFFSITDLLKTLFAPFRQDVIDTSRAPLGVKLQAFGGNIISRIFGFFIRTTLIFVGLFTILLYAVVGLFATLVWPLLPMSPIIALLLLMNGVGL